MSCSSAAGFGVSVASRVSVATGISVGAGVSVGTGEVPGVREIQNGETLHITEDADLVDGSHWGVTTIDGTEGWMDLEKTEEWAKEHGTYENPQTSEAVDMTPVPMQEGDAVSAGKSVSPTVTEVPEASATPTLCAIDRCNAQWLPSTRSASFV